MSKTKHQDAYTTITREQFEQARNDLAPLEDKLIAGTNVNNVAAATAQAEGANSRVASMQDRMRARYGIQAATGQTAHAENRMRTLSDASNTMSTANRQTIADRDLRMQSLGAMANIGNTKKGIAMENLSSAAQAEHGRNMAHKQAKAQNRASTIGAIGSIVGAGATLMMMT